jgi:Ribbon-helix-helix protein, copG family
METDRLVRVTVTLDAADVDLLDRLAQLEGLNRSAELRSILGELRPMLRQTVETFEAALRQRDAFDQAAAATHLQRFEALIPEVEKLQDAYLGAMARLEGAATAAQQSAEPDPRPSNHGGHTPTPTTPPTDEQAD